MKLMLPFFLIAFVVCVRADGQTNPVSSTGTSGKTVETIVCIRHGEKPTGEIGQLNCRGLNRALALPKVLLAKYGSPQFVFAPNPAQKVNGKDGKIDFNYVRPLATIEPTAIRCGLPVNTQFGFREIKGLESELQKNEYRSATIFVAWEHVLLDEFVKNLLKTNGGNSAQVPAWPENDYDTIFLVKITRAESGVSVAFTIDREGLNDLSDACP
jgi:hypothetical protein